MCWPAVPFLQADDSTEITTCVGSAGDDDGGAWLAAFNGLKRLVVNTVGLDAMIEDEEFSRASVKRIGTQDRHEEEEAEEEQATSMDGVFWSCATKCARRASLTSRLSIILLA